MSLTIKSSPYGEGLRILIHVRDGDPSVHDETVPSAPKPGKVQSEKMRGIHEIKKAFLACHPGLKFRDVTIEDARRWWRTHAQVTA